MDKEPRIKIIQKIGQLEDQHCETCTLQKTHGNYARYCSNRCEIGKKIKNLGDQLLKVRQAKETGVKELPKINSKDFSETLYNELKAEGHSNKEIAEMVNKSEAWIYGQKKLWGEGNEVKEEKGAEPTQAAYDKLRYSNKELRAQLDQAKDVIKNLESESERAFDQQSNNDLIEELAATKEKMGKLYKFVGKLVVENNLLDLG